jgi:hypothetical protein
LAMPIHIEVEKAHFRDPLIEEENALAQQL